jgi:2-polyprenyl-3-methyl-5-hydroxy-6-metoxy-1,4-benzoquinol methylase
MRPDEPDFTRRAKPDDLPEWMDAPCSYEDFRDCLRDLAAVNRVTLAHRPTRAFLDSVVQTRKDVAPLRIVDAGCGGGDALRAIERWARRRNVAVTLTGVDLNPHAARAAAEATPGASAIRYVTADVLDYLQQEPTDIVLSSLFTHHLPAQEIVRFLRAMEAHARVGWFINDLHRGPQSYRAFTLLAKLARWHRFVQHDGPVSIRRSFRAEDWNAMLGAAEIRDAVITPWRPGRLCVARLQ